MWVRGLKPEFLLRVRQLGEVAPHVGAWIETLAAEYVVVSDRSHPMWVRGLKLNTKHI